MADKVLRGRGGERRKKFLRLSVLFCRTKFLHRLSMKPLEVSKLLGIEKLLSASSRWPICEIKQANLS